MPPTAPALPAQRLEFLDALRGLAALYVLVFHVAVAGRVYQPEWLGSFVVMGGSGVTLFFLVSAFSLCLSSGRLLASPGGEAVFWLRRFFRIAPLFYVAIAATMVRDFHLSHIHHHIGEVLLNLGFVFNLVPSHFSGIPDASWTIGVEMLFYALFPFIYRATRQPLVLACAIVASFLLAGAALTASYYLGLPEDMRDAFMRFSLFRQLQLFLMGIAVFDINAVFRRHYAGRIWLRDLGRLLLWLSAFLYYGWLHGALGFPFPELIFPGLGWQGVIYGVLMLGLGLCPTKLLVNRISDFLGRISYSVYLLHLPIIHAMVPVYAWIDRRQLAMTPHFCLAVAITLAIVLPLATLTHYLIEVPGMRLGAITIARLGFLPAKPAAG